MKLKGEELLQKVRCCRSLLPLLSDAALRELASTRCADRSLIEQIFAEAVFRSWLFQGGQSSGGNKAEPVWCDLLKKVAPDEQALERTLKSWLQSQIDRRSYEVPVDLHRGDLRQGGHLLSKNLDTWRNADGFITFVGNPEAGWIAEAVAMPFILRQTESGEGGGARAFDGTEIAGLAPSVYAANHSAALRASNGTRPGKYDIWLPTISGESVAYLGGASAGLPILLGISLKTKSLPLDPFAWAACGVLSASGGLDTSAQSEDTLRAKTRLLAAMGIRRIIACGDGDDIPQLPAVRIWTNDTHLEAGIGEMMEFAKTKAAVASSSLAQLEESLGRIDRHMHHGSLHPASAVEQLTEILETSGARNDLRSRELQNRTKLLLATAECHAGNPEKGSRWAQEAMDGRTQLGSFALGRGMIRQAVNLTDLGDYREAVAMAKRARDITSEAGLSPSQRLILEMEAAGTIGQALTFEGVTDPAARSPALDYLQRAVELAREFDAGEAEARELPRDLCYLYQWHAFFDRSGCAEVWDQFQESAPAGHSSLDFIKRLRWLAAYRALLDGEAFDWKAFGHDLPNPSSAAGDWLYRLALKYRGALRAAGGETDGAIQDFGESVRLIEYSESAPILGLIGTMAALEAYRSLRKSHPEAALTYHQYARETLQGDLPRFHHTDCPRLFASMEVLDESGVINALYPFPY
jgi:hypothetical protein